MGTKAGECVPSQRDYVLRLFVTGHTRKSARAVQNITQICEIHLNGRYDLQVVDVYQQPELALEHNLVAAPTLMKLLPLPPRSLVGDMSDRARVLSGLGVAV